jgi:hypothetical protein
MPRTALACAVFLLFAAIVVPAQDKQLAHEIVVARYVMVVAEGGADPLRQDREDRRAIAAVEAAIRDWGRYALTYTPENADLVIAVRVGRLASIRVGGRVGTSHPGGGTYGGPMAGVEAGMPWDTLRVFRGGAADFSASALLLSYQEKDGLALPRLPVFRQFRRDVEGAAGRRTTAEDWKKASRSIETRVRELAAAEKLHRSEAGRLVRLITDRVRASDAMTARVVEGDLQDVDRLFRELRAR